jgi:transmembrane sensor
VIARPQTEDVAALAARWFARRRRGLTEAERRELAAWLEADAAHLRAYRGLQVAWRDVEAMRDDPGLMALRAEAIAAAPDRRRLVQAVAAMLAVAVIGSASLAGVSGLWPGKRFSDQAYRTEVGQRATVTLPDGSVVTLNTDSVVRTRASHGRRLVYLDKGQAFFRVAKDKRHPFVVTAAGRTITALGTAFDVRVDNGRLFEVTLVEGKVRVEAPGLAAATPVAGAAPKPVQAVEMTAGAQLHASLDTGEQWNLTRADVQRETSWVSGQLVFHSEPLREVVAELNRYSDKKIVIGQAAYADRPISGTFKAGDVDTFARGLERYQLARVEEDTADVIRLGAP